MLVLCGWMAGLVAVENCILCISWYSKNRFTTFVFCCSSFDRLILSLSLSVCSIFIYVCCSSSNKIPLLLRLFLLLALSNTLY